VIRDIREEKHTDQHASEHMVETLTFCFL